MLELGKEQKSYIPTFQYVEESHTDNASIGYSATVIPSKAGIQARLSKAIDNRILDPCSLAGMTRGSERPYDFLSCTMIIFFKY